MNCVSFGFVEAITLGIKGGFTGGTLLNPWHSVIQLTFTAIEFQVNIENHSTFIFRNELSLGRITQPILVELNIPILSQSALHVTRSHLGLLELVAMMRSF